MHVNHSLAEYKGGRDEGKRASEIPKYLGKLYVGAICSGAFTLPPLVYLCIYNVSKEII